MNKKALFLISFFLVFLITAAAFFISKTAGIKNEKPSNISYHKNQKVKFAVIKSTLCTLPFIAYEKKYFQEECLDVEFQYFQVGKDAFESILNGENDISFSLQTPPIIASFTRNDFKIFASIASDKNQLKIAARDIEEKNAKNYFTGKTINTQSGTAMEYFLSLVLDKNGVDKNTVKITNYSFSESFLMIKENKIDALITFDPFTDIATGNGKKAEIISEPGLYTTYGILTSMDSYLKENPLAIEKILKALNKGANYYYKNKEEIEKFLSAKYFDLSADSIKKQMAEINYEVMLNQNFILLTEREAEWVASTKLFNKKERPDLFNIVDEKPLKKVFPKNVNIER